MKSKRIFLLGLAFALSACSSFPGFSQDEATLVPDLATSAEAAPTETPASEPAVGAVTLQIWVPPQFAPDTETAAGLVLQDRLDEFSVRHPGVRVIVRVKAESGEAGIYDSLGTASHAAPMALPDLIALPSAEMQLAASKNYIYPISPYLFTDTVEDWFDYAQSMGDYVNIQFGIPFAGDAMVMAYRTSVIENAPRTWQAALENGGIFSFPAGDPLAVFSLAQYQALGGEFQDDTGDLILNEQELTTILNLYDVGQQSGLLPSWLTQYDAEALAWQTFRENRAQMAVTWYTDYIADIPSGSQIAPLPTFNGEAFTYANGWVWALSSPDSRRHAISIELAEFLSEAEFLAEWNTATGHLPTRPSALGNWQEGTIRAVASQILPTAVILPDTLTLSSLGTPLHEAVIAILKQSDSVQEIVAAVMAEFDQ